MMNTLFPRGAKSINPQPPMVASTSAVGGTNWMLVQAAAVMRQSFRRSPVGPLPDSKRISRAPEELAPQPF